MNTLIIAFACFAVALLLLVGLALWAVNTPINRSDDIEHFFDDSYGKRSYAAGFLPSGLN